EYRGFRILIDRNDSSRILHTHDMLYRPGDAEGDIQLWSYGLAARTDLAVDGQPFAVTYRPRGRQVSSQSVGKLLSKSKVLFRFDAPADSHDHFRFSQVNRRLGFLERCLGRHSDVADIHVHSFDPGLACRSVIAAKCT